jgi:hypothetical protein
VSSASTCTGGTSAGVMLGVSSALRNTWISWWRSAGSFASAFKIACSMRGGMAGLTWLGGIGCALLCFWSKVVRAEPEKGTFPVSSS